MLLFINSKQKKNGQTCTNISRCNWVLISCPSTVALQLCETYVDSCQVFSEWAMFPWSTNTEVSSALWHVSGAEVMLILRQCQETQQIDQTAFFCPSSCQDAVLLAGKAARMWKQHITINMKLFFTLYILSIFTHKMYMIGMHIIFLLTDSFNKELCQSAAVVSTSYLICRWKYYSSSELSPQLKC